MILAPVDNFTMVVQKPIDTLWFKWKNYLQPQILKATKKKNNKLSITYLMVKHAITINRHKFPN